MVAGGCGGGCTKKAVKHDENAKRDQRNQCNRCNQGGVGRISGQETLPDREPAGVM